jgi:hypothetical protein
MLERKSARELCISLLFYCECGYSHHATGAFRFVWLGGIVMYSLGNRRATRGAGLIFVCIAATGGLASSAHANLIISSGATKNVSCSDGVCTATASNAVLNAANLESMLASSSVKVATGSVAKAIDVRAALTWSSASTLSLDAYQSIFVNKAVASNGSGGLTFVTNDGGSSGVLEFGAHGNASFASLSGHLTINGNAYTLANSVTSLASAAGSSRYIALAVSYDASADGTYSSSPLGEYQGTFEGLGNTISNLSIDDEVTGDYTGLFYLTSGTVENISLSKVNVTSSAADALGGLVGDNQGTIFNAHAQGSIVGGMIDTGGLAGYNFGTISASSARGRVVGNNAGGLVGLNGSSIVNSYALVSTRAVNGGNTALGGGLVGENQGTIAASFAGGQVTSAASDTELGGLVGINFLGSIANSYSTGAVSEKGFHVAGGLVGFNLSGTVTDSYATGAVSSKKGEIGGLVGDDLGTFTSSYWDTDTSGVTNLSQGAGNVSNDPGITGLSSAQLQSGLPGGFDPAVWAESPSLNNGFPYLIANPPD